ncbi:unnamed protein product, partial [marine sediment metagenome]
LPMEQVMSPTKLIFEPTTEHIAAAVAANKKRTDAQTRCKHGHEFTAANTGRSKEGWRQCRACARDKQRRYKETGSYKR